MRSVALIALLSVIAQAHAEEATDMTDLQNSMDQLSDEFMNKLADKLVDRVGASFLHNADLDTTTLEKPGHPGLLESNLPIQASFGPEQEDDGTLADYDDQIESEDMLDCVLSLEGGAAKKPMAAMKAMAAMAAPMKSVGKAKKKPLNEYMTKCMEAKKTGAKSFVYNGKTYVSSKTKTGLVVYKAR